MTAWLVVSTIRLRRCAEYQRTSAHIVRARVAHLCLLRGALHGESTSIPLASQPREGHALGTYLRLPLLQVLADLL